ncbi:MAG: HlyD family efflux transporter periplasmic adaptor subunit [Pseudonocardia sp.]|nr:HlyD family efflux transporter periplasmic adaptor subunit [Pseudonocardia sp.]MBO0873783.1 HlyD family efflux transporter periplasmic adaptor subunit [Pseudonocardia sp.]
MEGPTSGPGTATEDRPELNGASKASTNGAAPTQTAEPGKKSMKRSTKTALIIIIVLALLAALGFGGAYFLYSRQFVSTDNAQVDGDKVQIVAPVTGTLVDWRGSQGTQVKRDQVVGRIKQGGSGAQPQRIMRAPGDGTIAVNNGVEGSWVTAGTQLATAYDLNNIYITARVDETDVRDVHPGALVDVSVDAFGNTPVSGIVSEVQGAAAGVFSLFPESNSTGNFQKVTQVIPVRIMIANSNGLTLVPGMNVTVKIHKQ